MTQDANGITGHRAVAAALRAHGVTHVYGIGGLPIHETLAACVDAGIRAVGVHHQQNAAYMSIAHNYAAGRVASAVVVSAGPAVTNVVTGMLVAHDNAWPLVVLGGRRPLSMAGQGAFQELDAVPVMRPLAKHAALVATPDELAPAVAHACRVALDGRPGPVYLDVPEDALHGRTLVGATADASPVRPAPVDPDAVALAAALLRNAKRPALLFGEGLRWRDAHASAARLVAALDAPFATTPVGQGIVGDDHPRCANPIRPAMLAGADVVLVAGAPLDWRFRFGAEIARDAARIHAPLGTFARRPGDVAMDGDAGRWLAAVADALEREPRERPVDARWQAELDAAREARRRQDDALATDPREPMTEHRLAAEVRRALPADAFLVVDGNRILAAVQRQVPSVRPTSRLTPAHDGCMGVGVPFGIGVALAQPGRPVVVVTGDLALGLCMMELETAARIGAPIVVVVANNDGNAGGRQERKLYPDGRPDRVTQFGPGLRYDTLAQALGAHGERVERCAALGPALARALASGRAALVDVAVDVLAP